MLSALIKCNIGFYDEFLSVATFGFLSLNAWTSKLFVVSNWLAIYFSPKYGFLSKLLVKKSIRKLAFCQCDVLRGKIIVINTRFYYSLPRLQIFHNFKALINHLRFKIVHKFFQENVKVGLVFSWGPTRIWPLKSSPPTQVPPYLPTQGWLYPLHSSIHIHSQLRGPNFCLQDWEIKLHHKILLWLLRKQLSVCIQHFYKQRMCWITRRTK